MSVTHNTRTLTLGHITTTVYYLLIVTKIKLN